MGNNKIAVVTGANGFVGSHLVDLLLQKDFEVRCIVRNTSDLKWLKGKKVEFFDCGLLNRDGLRNALKDANFVFHLAGVVKSQNPAGYYRGNVETTQVLLETIEEFRDKIERVVVLSSQAACGPSNNEQPVTEEKECKPITTYGRSKLEEERITHKFMNKFPVTICRAPAVYGQRDTEVFIFFKLVSLGLFLSAGIEEKLVSLIHVEDLVNGLYLAATSQKGIGETYFISPPDFYTWEDVEKAISRELNKKTIHIKVPGFLLYIIAAISQFVAGLRNKPATLNIEKAKDLTRTRWTCDSSKAAKELGFRQQVSLEEGIKKTVAWYKSNGWI